MNKRSSRLTLCGALTVAAALWATPAMALYKIVGPDGKVTYTDRAPLDVPSQAMNKSGVLTDPGTLPFAVRQAVSRYPVTLYVGESCAPCDQVRTLLKQRGVPFTEKLIRSPADAAELSKLEGTTLLPVGRVGAQQIMGSDARAWQGYLDAAGYPKESQLPRNHAWSAATPLVAAKPVPPAASQPSAADARNRLNPAGAGPQVVPDKAPPAIRF
jgi:glutaredoxin